MQLITFCTMRTRNGKQLDYQFQKKCPDSAHERDKMQSVSLSTISSTKNWTLAENGAYVEFLKDNDKVMKDESNRRSSKIFLEMSLFIRTKTPEQCRTHHQKVLGKYESIEKIMSLYLQDQEKRKRETGEQKSKYKEVVTMVDCCMMQEIGRPSFIITIKSSELEQY